MAAHGDDLRHFYSERIGDSIVVAVGAVSVALAEALTPGRYMLHTLDVAGASALWVRQGPFGEVPDAVAAAPNTPIDLLEDSRLKLNIMARPPGQGTVATPATNGLKFITDAGTVNVVITRISNG